MIIELHTRNIDAIPKDFIIEQIYQQWCFTMGCEHLNHDPSGWYVVLEATYVGNTADPQRPDTVFFDIYELPDGRFILHTRDDPWAGCVTLTYNLPRELLIRLSQTAQSRHPCLHRTEPTTRAGLA